MYFSVTPKGLSSLTLLSCPSQNLANTEEGRQKATRAGVRNDQFRKWVELSLSIPMEVL